MKLQTEIKLKKQEDNLIDYNSKLLLFGSCFSENIGDKLDYFKFQRFSNPFGILFHPKAVEVVIERAVFKKEYLEQDVFFYNEQWHCYDAHSKLSNISKENLLQELNANLEAVNNYLKDVSHVVITLGTAWVYSLVENNVIVANCHKVPQKKFNKTLLSIDEIVKSLQKSIELIQSVNKKVSITFTVSPVRHIKDGFIENTLSKSHLIAAIHLLLKQQSLIKKKGLTYFPSYEIMLDELRDYRFYKNDMLHPSEIAIQYIWEKFKQTWVKQEIYKTMDHIDTIQKGLKHIPKNKSSHAHLKFIEKLNQKKEVIQSLYPQIIF
ncbi:GSCFA domain-containing protein [uncultured Lacinutrix sp.]|uniref:GSCFA domain-containing protein n=1 Tax=uncultured Lacinutrix sp. TaxID=574032 RepID=UPI00261178A0|nr:GSCFA domain-containing protein [uncultured Lacinutrix sp.]